MDAVRAGRRSVLDLATSLTDDEWAAPSACEGWRVQDVIVHMASVFRQMVEPGAVPTAEGDDIELDNDVAVDALRGLTPAEAAAYYEEWSGRGLEALTGLQSPPMAEVVIPLKNLGSHPLHLLADATAFDHDCHLRHDLLAPRGPIDRPAPPVDDTRMAPTMTWMLTGMPQMNAAALGPVLTAPVAFALHGPGGARWVLSPGDAGGPPRCQPAGAAGAAADPAVRATIGSSTEDFVVWGTRRKPWRDAGVTIEGDTALATAVLDAINIV